MRALRRLMMFVTGSALVLVAASASGRTEGPFTAQIVDADTGQPIAGVVVVALYQRRKPGLVHPEVEFYDLDETVSDADGRISIPARELPPSTPLSHITGPEMIVFKAGYRSWKFRGVEVGQHVDPNVRDRQFQEAWRKFRSTGVTIEMPRAKNRDDRRWATGRAHRFPPIPEDGAPHLRQALDDEMQALSKMR